MQLARASGVAVIGTSRTPAKLEKAKALGLDIAIDASGGDWVARVEEEVGVEKINAVLDLVGGDYLDGDLRVLAKLGRIIQVGLTAGARTSIDLRLLMQKRLRIYGTMLRSRALEEKIELAREFSERVLPLFETGLVAPIVDRVFSFDEVRAAHELMESNDTFGKIVLKWD